MRTKTRIVKIGNSRGSGVPKVFLKQTRRPRAGWAKAALAMRERGHDALLDEPTPTRFDREEWQGGWG